MDDPQLGQQGLNSVASSVNSASPVANQATSVKYVSDLSGPSVIEDPNASLETNTFKEVTTSQPQVPSNLLSKRRAVIVSLIITFIVVLISTITLALLIRKTNHTNQQALNNVPSQDVSIPTTSFTPNGPYSNTAALVVNGNIVSTGELKVTKGDFTSSTKLDNLTADRDYLLPNSSGTICLSSNNCNFVTSQGLQAAVNSVDIPTSIVITKVVSSGGGASITTTVNGLSDSITIQGTANQVSVNSSGSVITLGTPQNLNSSANVQFGNLTLGSSGTVTANNLLQTGAGNDITIDAGSDRIVFSANGKNFIFPTTGSTGQTICTTAITCASGGGQAVLLAPDDGLGTAEAQENNSANPSIFINNTGGANLIELQTNGSDEFTVASSGNTTIGGVLGVNTITPSAAFTVGATGQSLTLRGTTSTLTSNGAGNDITLTSADQIIFNSTGTIELQDNTNVTGNVDISGTLTAATGNAFQVSASGVVTYVSGTTDSASPVCRNTSGQLASCTTSGAGAFFIQGGNSFAAQAVLGTNDSNSLAFRTAGTNRLVLSTTGNLQFQQASTISTSTGNLTVQANGTSTLALNTTGAGTVNLGSTNSTTLNIGNNSSTTNILGNVCVGSSCGYLNINSGTASIDIGSGGTTAISIGTAVLDTVTIGSVNGTTDINGNTTNINTSGGITTIGNLNGSVTITDPYYSISGLGNIQTLGTYISPFGGFGGYNNLLVRSEAFDNSSWTKTNVSAPSADSTVSPDGNTTAESLADSASGGSVSQVTTTVPTNNSYTFSVWLKATAPTSASLQIDGSTGGTGAETSAPVTSSWQRFSVTENTNGFTGFIKVLIYPGSAGGSATVKAWGAQLEKTSTPGVYVHTTAVTVAASNNSTTPVTSGLQGLVSNGGAFINSQNASGVGLIVQGFSSQTADIVDFQNNSGTNLFALSSAGAITLNAASAVTSTQITTATRNSSFASALSLAIQPGSYAGVGGTGGSLTLQGGAETDTGGTGGAVTIIGGTGVVAGGAASLTGGTGTTTGGAAIVVGGTGSTTGGAANLTGGVGTTTGGAVNITGGAGTTTGANVAINAGTGATNGNVLIGTTIDSPNITIGSSTTNNGTITLGQSVNTNTINIGNATQGNAKTQTINIGNQGGSGSGNSSSVITIGSDNQSSAITLLVGAGNFVLNGVANSSYTIGTNTTTGNILIGGTAQSTGALTLGRSTATNTVTIGSSAGNGSTQTINLGTSATSGSTTNVNIGSTIAGTTTLRSAGGTAITSLGTADTSTLLCRNSSNIIATCTGSLSGTAFVQGGNSFGATGVLGTNDSNDLNIRANGTDRIVLTSAGNVSVQAASSGTLSLGTTNANTIAIGSTNASTITTILGGGGINIGTGAASTIQIGSTSSAIAQTIGIGNNATGSSTDTIQIGNLLTTSTTNIQGGTGTSAVTIKAGASGTIGIGNDNTITQRVLLGSTEASSVVSLSAGANINIGVNDTSAINIGAVGVFAHTIAIGTPSGATQTITLGSNEASSTTNIRGFNGITIGGSVQTGTITLGQSTAGQTINIGHATVATGNTQTIQIGDAATGTGKDLITIGNTNGASSTTIQGGTGGISLTGNTTVAATDSFTVTAGATSLTGLAAGSSDTLSVTTGAASNRGIFIQAASSQTANLFEAKDSGGLTLFRVGPAGALAVANNNSSIGGLTQISGQQLTLYTGSGGNVALAVRPNSGVTQTADLVQIQDSTGAVLDTIDKSGKLGIGTTAPTSKLQINTTGAGDATAQLFINTGADANRGIVLQQFSNSQSEALLQVQNSSGTGLSSVDPQGRFLAPNGSSSTPGFGFFSDSDTGMYRAAANELGFITGASERLRIDSTGNVGIGDTSPAALLTVGSGDLFRVNSSGAITAVTGITTSGNILPNAPGTIDLGSTSAEFSSIYVGDNNGLVLGLSQNATLAYDAATDNRVELTGSGASLFIEDKLSFGAQSLTLSDDGAANDSLTPSATYVRVDIDETADGSVPDLTISETGAKDGQLLIITNNEQDASEDTFTITNSAGVVQLPGGSTLTLGPNDSVTLLYMNDRWVTLSNSNN